MAALIATIVFIIFSVLMFKDERKWFPFVFSIFYFVLPKEACMIGDLKPNILILVVMLGVVVYKGLLKKLFDSKFNYVILFYIVSSATLSVFSINDISYTSQISYLVKKVVEMFLLGLLTSAFILHVSDVSRFVKTFYAFVLIGSIYGIFSYVIHANPYMAFISTSFRDGIPDGASDFLNEVRGVLNGRVAGFTNHPLNWGQFHLLFLTALPFFKKYISKRLYIATFLFSSFNILLTGSRSSIAPLMLFLIGYFLIENRQHFVKIISVAGFVFLFIMILGSVVHNEYIDSIRAYVCFWDESASEKISVGGSSVSLREDQLDSALYFIGGTKLLVGYGYGYVSNMPPDHFMRESLLGFESVILKLVIEQGLLGVLFYFLMFVFFCFIVMQYRKKLRDRLLVLLMFVAYVSSLLFTGERCTFQLFFVLIMLIMQERLVLYKDLITVLKLKQTLAKPTD